MLDDPGLGHGVPDPDAVGARAPRHGLHLLAVRPVRADGLGAELHVEAEAPEHDGHAHTVLQRRERDLVSLHCSTTIPSAILFSSQRPTKCLRISDTRKGATNRQSNLLLFLTIIVATMH